jgi:hypothetical protein
MRRSILVFALLGLLFFSSGTAFADERGTFVQTSLTGTTISGYVNASAQWNFDTEGQNGFRGWFRTFLLRLRHFSRF